MYPSQPIPGRAANPGLLEGTLVVSMEQAVAAPFATRQLADLGARVIKVERPLEGDLARGYDETVLGLSSHFVWLNRGKESIEVDARGLEGIRTMRALLDRADVFVQNLAPGAAERLGLGSRQLRAERPDLITCDISGFGAPGPYANRKAYDLLIQNEAGLVDITGTVDKPSKVGISIADIATGMYAYSGILSALMRRWRIGVGAGLEVSMLEALGEWMGYADYYTRYGGRAPGREGAGHATIAPYGPFTCSDGKVISLGVQNEREWATFCTAVLRQPSLVADPRFRSNSLRVKNKSTLDRIIDECTRSLTSTELVTRLESAPIAYAAQRTMSEFARHPQLAARERWEDFDTPNGPVRGLIPPVTVDGVRPHMAPVPALGEHTDSILEWLGLDLPLSTSV